MSIPVQEIVAAAADLNRTSVSGPRILARFSDPNIPAGEIGELVSNDVHLTVRVLRVANSALYGRSRRITQVDQAVTMLGLDAIRSIVVASCFRNNFGCMRSDGLIDFVEYYRHSLSVAITAEKLARIRQPQLAGEAFVAGLLHDFGVQVLVRLDADGVGKLKSLLLADPAANALEAEAALVRVGHEVCGIETLRAWSFPECITAVAGNHHRPLLAPPAHRDLACLVNLADTVSRTVDAGFCLELNREAPDERVLQAVQLTNEDLASIAADLPGKVQALDQLLI